MNKAIIFSAPSGAGKTTIVKELLRAIPRFEFSISACSRGKRTGEVDGKDYYFISVEDFKQKIERDEFLEWQEVYNGSFYGTLKSEVERIAGNGNFMLFDVDVVGGLNIKRYFGDNALSIFVMPPSLETLEQRLVARSTDSPEAIAKRIAKAKYEMTFAERFDKIIVNQVLETAVEETILAVKSFLEM